MPKPKANTTTAREPIHGVFSTMEIKKVGSGESSRKAKVKQFWLVQEQGNDLVEVQPINENLIPIGKKRTIGVGTLLERFSPEPEFFVHDLGGHEPGGSELDMGEPGGRDEAPGQRLEVEGFDLTGNAETIERNARASFGIGLTHLKRGNREKAKDIFTQLAETKASYKPVHKHMFNEFGISLRKQDLVDTALKHYLRALELASDDENLHHNIARVYFEKKDYRNALRFLEKSLEINPNLRESQLFLNYIRRKFPTSVKPVRMDF